MFYVRNWTTRGPSNNFLVIDGLKAEFCAIWYVETTANIKPCSAMTTEGGSSPISQAGEDYTVWQVHIVT